MSTGIVSIITTKDRPEMLARTLPGVVALGARVLVVDDGSSALNAELNHLHCDRARPLAPGDVLYMSLPENRGLAAALNMALSFWMADRGVEYISYFQDDVEVDPLTHQVLIDLHRALGRAGANAVLTGHDAREHRPINGPLTVAGIRYVRKASCRATHMMATAEAWKSVMPIRSKGVGYPKRVPGRDRGEGSDADWYITRDARDDHKRPLQVHCVPGLVRTFSWRGEDSTWENTQIAGEDAPLSRESIIGWRGHP